MYIPQINRLLPLSNSCKLTNMAKRGPIAKTKAYTPMAARIEKIIKNMQLGHSKTAAAAAAGVSYDTFQHWQNRPVVAEAIAQAEAEGELLHSRVIHKAATGFEVKHTRTITNEDGSQKVIIDESTEFDWKASKYWLEARRRREWGTPILTDRDAVASTINNNAYLTLIKIVQNKGVSAETSSDDQDLFGLPESGEAAAEIDDAETSD